MLKLIYCLRRLPHLTQEEFQGHWLEHHAQFGRRSGKLLRYVQYHTLAHDPIREAMAQAGGGVVEPFDGVAIAWWNSPEDMIEDMKNGADVAAALEDEKWFIDQARSVACLTEERVIVEPRGNVPYVLIECLRRQSGMDRARFQEAWLEHSRIGWKAHAMGLLMGYIQNHTLLKDDTLGLEKLNSTGETWDGVVTAYFESVAKFKALVASPLAAEESFEDERKFINHELSAYMTTRRHMVKDVIR